uniref:uncharacterized protein n=1 Tax=Myxine glutinosa TaxID=7769 RepID=UPI00358EC094
MMGDVQDSQETCALTPQLARSESRMSLDSIESAEINVTIDTDNSSLSQKWRHIAPFFKVVDSKATCTKAGGWRQPSCARKGTKGFDGRFSHLFVDMDLLMATALHPQHKLATVRAICRRQNNDAICDLVRDKLIRDLLALVLPDEHLDPAPQQGPQPGSSSTDYLFAMEEGQQEENLEEKIREEVNNWSRKPLRGNPGLSPNLFPLEFRDAWVTLFLRHNTPLPSSASVERVFSYGSDILRPKRSALAAPNFEALVFMKGNLQILKKAHEVEEEDED